MSNLWAISTVNAALKRKVLAAAIEAVEQADVRLGPPTAKLATDGKALVNIHVYRVETNALNANEHLATRASDGSLRGPSRLSLDLHYVISFYGDSEKFVPDHMLASVMMALEHEPELSRQSVKQTIKDQAELAESDLDKAIARLRVTREVMSLEDFSKVWSIFYQVPYVISLSYVVSHVMLQSADLPKAAIPVGRTGVWSSPLNGLRLDSASGASSGPGVPVVWGGTLFVTGRGLGQFGMGLTLDALDVDMAQVAATEQALAVPMTAATLGGTTLTVGLHGLRALAPLADPAMPAYLRDLSNTLPFALHPSCVPGAVAAPAGGTKATGTVVIKFSPAIAVTQAVRLLLDDRDPQRPAQFILPSPDRAQPVTEITFAFTDLPRGSYLVRGDVDGLLSPVLFETAPASPNFGNIIGPVVAI